MRNLIGFICAFLVLGCGYSPGLMPDKKEASGKLLFNGKPLTNVKVVLQPLGEGSDAHAMTDGTGSFKAQTVPGKYTWYISPKDDKKASEGVLKNVPEAYRSGSLERVVETDKPLELVVR